MSILGLFSTIAKVAAGVAGATAVGGPAGGIISALPSIIQLVEKVIPNKQGQPSTGPQKKEAVIAIVREMLLTAEGFTGKDIMDEAAFTSGLDQAIEGIVRMLNATGWKSASKPTIT